MLERSRSNNLKTKAFVFFTLVLILLNSCTDIESIDHTNGHGQAIRKYNKIVSNINKQCTDLLKKDISVPIEYVWMENTDAKISMIQGKRVITLNLNILKYYSDNELAILLSHEYFHIFQDKYLNVNSWKYPMLTMLFMEGGATLFSEIQNPGMNDWKYISLWKQDAETYNKYIENSKESLEELKTKWYTVDQKDIDKYFSGSEEKANPWPERTGYYWGYKIMKSMYDKIGMKVFEMTESEFMKILIEYK